MAKNSCWDPQLKKNSAEMVEWLIWLNVDDTTDQKETQG